jgi:hypothetical protein
MDPDPDQGGPKHIWIRWIRIRIRNIAFTFTLYFLGKLTVVYCTLFTRHGASYAEVVNNPSVPCDARCSVISLRIFFSNAQIFHIFSLSDNQILIQKVTW